MDKQSNGKSKSKNQRPESLEPPANPSPGAQTGEGGIKKPGGRNRERDRENERKRGRKTPMQQRRGGGCFTLGLVDQLLEFQGGRCGICSVLIPESGMGKRAADHCSKTNMPRGILCWHCNVALGFYEKGQRLNGLVIEPYEAYLAATPFVRSGFEAVAVKRRGPNHLRRIANALRG